MQLEVIWSVQAIAAWLGRSFVLEHFYIAVQHYQRIDLQEGTHTHTITISPRFISLSQSNKEKTFLHYKPSKFLEIWSADFFFHFWKWDLNDYIWKMIDQLLKWIEIFQSVCQMSLVISCNQSENDI